MWDTPHKLALEVLSEWPSMESVLDKLSCTKGVRVHRPPTQDELLESVRWINCKLPKSYLEFLKSYGWVIIGKTTVFGLGPDAGLDQNVMEVRHKQCLRSGEVQLPPWFVAITSRDDNRFECLDTEHIRGGDCPIVLWDHRHKAGVFQKPPQIAPSFDAWLQMKLKEHGLLDPSIPLVPLSQVLAAKKPPRSRGTAKASSSGIPRAEGLSPKSQQSLDRLYAKMRKNSVIQIARGATTAEVAIAAKALSRDFPPVYVDFLLNVGFADMNGQIVYGFGKGVATEDSVVRRTLAEQDESVPDEDRLPGWLIAIADDGTGSYDCLDTRTMTDDCPVVYWNHEVPPDHPVRVMPVAKSFVSWLRRRVNECPNID